MSCCGKMREAARSAATGSGPASSSNRAAPPIEARAAYVVMFEYVGAGATTIVGPASGRRYRFTGYGDRVRVDPRDRPGLAAMAVLRAVR